MTPHFNVIEVFKTFNIYINFIAYLKPGVFSDHGELVPL